MRCAQGPLSTLQVKGKWLKKNWWTRRDSNPRPPRCERRRKPNKTRCCNHLRQMRVLSDGELGEPGCCLVLCVSDFVG